jgi:hypothetical protein
LLAEEHPSAMGSEHNGSDLCQNMQDGENRNW